MTFEPAQRDPREANAPTESFVTPSGPAPHQGPAGQGGTAAATAAPTAPPVPPAVRPAKPARQLSVLIASVLAAAALIVGGSIGFIIGHSSGSGSSTPTSGQLGPGGMGGYGGGMGGYGPPDGGTGGMPGQQQGSSATSTQSST